MRALIMAGGGEPAQPRGKTAYYPVRPAND